MSSPTSVSESSSGPSQSDLWQTEWSECRSTLGRFDGYLDPLRKQGFSLVSGLLTTTGLLSAVVGTSLTDWARAAILMVTEGLIVLIGFLEKNYRLTQEAVSARARVLEGHLNLGESETIASYYKKQGVWRYDLFMNFGFVTLTLALGLAILIPTWPFQLPVNWPLVAIVVATAIAYWLLIDAASSQLTPGVDLSVDKLSTTAGQAVVFTVVNHYPSATQPATRGSTAAGSGSAPHQNPGSAGTESASESNPAGGKAGAATRPDPSRVGTPVEGRDVSSTSDSDGPAGLSLSVTISPPFSLPKPQDPSTIPDYLDRLKAVREAPIRLTPEQADEIAQVFARSGLIDMARPSTIGTPSLQFTAHEAQAVGNALAVINGTYQGRVTLGPFPLADTILPFESVSWVWNTEGCKAGLYRWTLDWVAPRQRRRRLSSPPNTKTWVDIEILAGPQGGTHKP